MRIRREHTLGRDEARQRVDRVANELGSQFGVSTAWQGDDLEVTGSGVNGRIAVTDDAVEVDVQLGFALTLMEGAIRDAVERAMDRHLD